MCGFILACTCVSVSVYVCVCVSVREYVCVRRAGAGRKVQLTSSELK